MQRKQARKDSQDALRQPLLDGDEPETRGQIHSGPFRATLQ